MMEETTTSTLKSLNVNSKRLYRKHKDAPNELTTNHSNKVELDKPMIEHISSSS